MDLIEVIRFCNFGISGMQELVSFFAERFTKKIFIKGDNLSIFMLFAQWHVFVDFI